MEASPLVLRLSTVHINYYNHQVAFLLFFPPCSLRTALSKSTCAKPSPSTPLLPPQRTFVCSIAFQIFNTAFILKTLNLLNKNIV